MKIGIYGGTFDPVHLGHIKIALKTIEQLDLDQIWFVPAKIPPHKINSGVTNEIHRLNMLNEAIKDLDSRFVINNYELENDDVSYSYLTLTEFTAKYKNHKFYFIMGEDSLIDFSTWRHPEIIANLVEIVVVPRSVKHFENIIKYSSVYEKLYDAVIHVLNFELVDISSTDIREKIKSGENISSLIPKRVYNYILDHNLYK